MFYVYVYLDPRKPGYFKYESDKFCLFFEYEPFYIGKGKFTRLNDHLMFVKNRIKNDDKIKFDHTKSKIRKILLDDKEPIILKIVDNLSEKESFDYEIKIISLIKREKHGATLTGKKHSQETKYKIGTAHKGKIISLSSIQKCLETKRNKNYPKKHFSEEHKHKLSESNKGKHNIKHSQETRNKMSFSHKGKTPKISNEGRNKIIEGIRLYHKNNKNKKTENRIHLFKNAFSSFKIEDYVAYHNISLDTAYRDLNFALSKNILIKNIDMKYNYVL